MNHTVNDNNLANILAEKTALYQTQRERIESRPKNTEIAYQSKQLRYIQWCKKLYDDQFVSESRLLRYIREEITDSAKLKRGRHSRVPEVDDNIESESEDGEIDILGAEDENILLNSDSIKFSSVKMHVQAVVDLWKQQKYLAFPNTAPHPRENEIKEYLRRLKKEECENSKSNFEDRVRGTVEVKI